MGVVRVVVPLLILPLVRVVPLLVAKTAVAAAA